MSRALWKGVYIRKKKSKKYNNFFLMRSSNIPKSLLNKNILIHNGLKLKLLLVKSSHINFKVGEFFFTRKYKKIK